MITKRGFEYLIQITEPTEEDSGTEVLEEGSFESGEYYLDVQALYILPQDTIWWFRAICYEGETKYTADSWLKNVPTLTTSPADHITINGAEGNGILTNKGANDVTKRGFRIFKEYQGNQQGVSFYIAIAFGEFSVAGETKPITVTNELFEVVDYYWLGLFYRDIEEEGNFDLEAFALDIGGGTLGEGFGHYLKSSDKYLIQAFAENELGRGYGELGNGNTVISLVHNGDISEYSNKDYGQSMAYYLPPKNIVGTRYADKIDSVAYGDIVDFTTLGVDIPDVDDEQIDENKFEKTVTLGTIPDGTTVTRIGIRLGRTKACNELHYFEDGTFGSSDSVTFMIELEYNATYYIMPYYVIDYGDYEEEILGMLNYTDPDMEEEYLTNFPVEVTDDLEEDAEDKERMNAGGPTYDYRSILREIKCEKMGEQGLIDYYGRRRSQTISNHLIQSKNVCCVIVSDYLDKFQRLKLKVSVDIDMPIPFEREDAILLGDGKTQYTNTGDGTILFKIDGEGELDAKSYILTKIRKIGNINYTPDETMINLELEV